MKTELVDVSPTRKEIKIELEPEIVRQKFDSISDRFAKQANVPGFRRGHAPRSVVRTRFKTEIRGEVLRELIPDAVNHALEKHELAAIGEPDVHLDEGESLEKIGEGPISFHVGVEVFPTVELKNYKGLAAARRVRPINDDDVNQMLDQLREASAVLQPVEDRVAELGDTVTVSFHGKYLNQPEGESAAADIDVPDVDVVLGGPGVQQEFTDNLLGVNADEEKNFVVDYPQDFSSKGLAGKKVEYQAIVSAVRRKELPELDDEWARSLGEDFNSIDTLKAKVREDLERRAAADADQHLRSEVMRQLLAEHQFEVPQSFVDQQTNVRMENVVREMIGRGIDPRSQELNWEGAREELKGQAEADVRGSLLLERIAEAEQIEVSDEEIAAEIETIAQASRQPLEQVRATLTKDGGERSIAHRLRNRKALDLLIENAKVTDEEWKEEVAQESEVGSREAEGSKQ